MNGAVVQARLARTRAPLLLPALVGTVALVVLVYLFLRLDRGFDLTDEAYYLLWIDRPEAYGIAASMFGFVLSPIYHMLGSDPAAFRYFGLLASILAAAAMCWAVLRPQPRERVDETLISRAVPLLAAAAGTVTYYGWWVATLSYNWLPLPASFLLLTGLALQQQDRAPLLAALLIGLSGVLAFAGKPTTGGGFALVYLLGIVAISGFSALAVRRLVASSAACVVVIVIAITICVDPRIAFEQARAYVEFFGTSPAGGAFLTLVSLPHGYPVAILAALVAFRSRPWVAKVAGLVAVLAALSVAYEQRALPYAAAQGMVVMTASLAVVANCLAWSHVCLDGRALFVPSLAFVMPWVSAFGTSNELTMQTGIYVALPLAGSIATAYLCFGPCDWRAIVAALFAPCFGILALHAAESAPYRLGSNLSTQVHPVAVGGGTLRVNVRMRDFVESLRRQVAGAGFKKGTPLLDFSGGMPGVAFLLGGQPPMFPWLTSGYVFSQPLAAKIVAQLTPEQRRSAWLVDSDASHRFDPAFVGSLGFDLQNSYELVATAPHPLDGVQVRVYAPVGAVRSW